MSLEFQNFQRNPFNVVAVRVTAENIEEVAKWCRGQLRRSAGPGGRNSQRYIKVNVKRPLNERQTMAYVGDWVVTATDQSIQGFKVYTPKAFQQSYKELSEHMLDVLERMEDRSVEEDNAEQQGLFAEELRLSHKAS